MDLTTLAFSLTLRQGETMLTDFVGISYPCTVFPVASNGPSVRARAADALKTAVPVQFRLRKAFGP
jgi:hypothetical protein